MTTIEDRKRKLGEIRVVHASFHALYEDLRRTHADYGIAAAGQGKLVIGAMWSGRSFLANSLVAKHPEHHDEYGVLRPIVYVVTPKPCNYKAMLAAVLSGLEITASTCLSPQQLMKMLRIQIAEQQTKTIILDKFERVIAGVQEDQRGNAIAAVCDVIADTGCQLIAFGDRSLTKVFERAEGAGVMTAGTVAITPYRFAGAGQRNFTDALRNADAQMPTDERSGFGDGDMPLRFHGAASGLFPRAMHIIRLAGVNALNDGRTKRIDRKDLARAYGLLYRKADKENFFLTNDPAAIRPANPAQEADDTSHVAHVDSSDGAEEAVVPDTAPNNVVPPEPQQTTVAVEKQSAATSERTTHLHGRDPVKQSVFSI